MSKDKKQQQEVNEKTYLITSTQLMDIMRYLMTRPYGEVVTIMNKLSKKARKSAINAFFKISKTSSYEDCQEIIKKLTLQPRFSRH